MEEVVKHIKKDDVWVVLGLLVPASWRRVGMLHPPEVVEKYAADVIAVTCRWNPLSQLLAVRNRKRLPTY